jgi:hypothetical protein
MRVRNIVIGIVSGIIFCRFLLFVLQGFEPVWGTYGLLVVLGLFLWTIQWLDRTIFTRVQPAEGFAWGAGGYSFFLTFFMLIGLSVWSATIVSKQAEITADGNPYCIEVATRRGDYRAAKTWLDFSVFGMFAKGNLSRHAVLIVSFPNNRYAYHWSYMNRQFIGGATSNNFPVLCRLTENFAESLPVFLPKRTDNALEVTIGKRRFIIPEQYSPIIRTDSGTLQFLAESIVFTPVRHSRDVMPLLQQFAHTVTIDLNPEESLEALVNPLGEYTIKDLGAEYGLHKRVITHKNDISSTSPLFFRRNQKGKIQTLIQSWSGYASARHSFLHEGLLYTFYYQGNSISEWKEAENNLVKLIASFVTDIRRIP